MEDKHHRDASIDILKFIAVFFITWSHFDVPLGEYGALATGGAFGDSLFFFMSGYTLLLSKRKDSFFNWYKRRINRIYPTVFAWALVALLLFDVDYNIIEILLHGGGFFITVIMFFYLLFYPLKRFVPIDYWWCVMLVYFILQGSSYFLLNQTTRTVSSGWQWSGYFLSMLAGAITGSKKKEGLPFLLSRANKWIVLLCLGLSASLYYLLIYLCRSYAPMIILAIIPLVCFSYSLFELCSRSLPSKLYQKPWFHWMVRFMGGLCLEVYIVQPRIITDKLNNLFPLNLFLIFVAILMAAYILRSLGRLWAQTFKDEDYNWKEIIKPY